MSVPKMGMFGAKGWGEESKDVVVEISELTSFDTIVPSKGGDWAI
jgi:hypothetical protein